MFLSFPSVQGAVISSAIYNFEAVQNSASDPANLSSIQIGSTIYNTPIFPISYSNVSLDGTAEIRQNTIGEGVSLADGAAWETAALAAFQSRNLNYYQQLDGGNLGDKWRLDFGSSLPATDAVLISVTERNGNNPLLIEAFNASDSSLGFLSVTIGDLSPTGAISAGTDISRQEAITAATYPISDLIGTSTDPISYLEITNNFNDADGADGKVIFWSAQFSQPIPEPTSLVLLMISGLSCFTRRRSHYMTKIKRS